MIVILGATATGKSELAFRLAKRLNGRIVNADSIQVYRGLDAGSCKPSEDARREVHHDLIDVAEPHEVFSAGRFAREATTAIRDCRALGMVPIVAGGTGLYLRALLQGIAPMPPRDEGLRRLLYARAAASSPEALHHELMSLDPLTAERLGRRDLHRVVRALEVLALTGVPLSRHIESQAFRPDWLPALKIGLAMDRERLYRRIDRRVEAVFASGIVSEVEDLLEAGVPPEAHALKALGYREVVAHLGGEMDLARSIDLVKRNTRRYARRQIIWFRWEPGVHWFEVSGAEGEVEGMVDRIVALHEQSVSGGMTNG